MGECELSLVLKWPSDGGQGTVARMIDRLHADDAGRDFRMMAHQMRGQFRLGAHGVALHSHLKVPGWSVSL